MPPATGLVILRGSIAGIGVSPVWSKVPGAVRRGRRRRLAPGVRPRSARAQRRWGARREATRETWRGVPRRRSLRESRRRWRLARR